MQDVYKRQLAAFGLALLMGLSPLGNLADVHAAESEISQNAVTEKESKTESEHPVSEISEQTVTAEDITKDVSDKEFMAETCMEGIQYDPEKEDVTLDHIEAEDGSAYHPDQAGTLSLIHILTISSFIQTILLVLELHQIVRFTLADFTANREFHPAPKTLLFSCSF